MPFKPPIQAEITEYVIEKKPDWPMEFNTYYAEKFFNHYQAQGWRLANNVPMKDWKAAFNANWQTLKFKEDIDLLAKLQSKAVEQAIKSNNDPISYINNLIDKHERGEKLTKIDQLIKIYDWLKSQGLMRLPKDIIHKIIVESGNNKDYGKCASVHEYFNIMINKKQRL